MSASKGDRLGSEVVHELFGVNLQQQGRGFYVALELFAIVRGVIEEQPDALLRPGMFVQVKLVVSKNAPIVVVPKQAVYTVAGLSKIFAIQGNLAREIRFTPGESGDTWLEIPAGLVNPGDRVALDKLAVLTDGAEVRVE